MHISFGVMAWWTCVFHFCFNKQIISNYLFHFFIIKYKYFYVVSSRRIFLMMIFLVYYFCDVSPCVFCFFRVMSCVVCARVCVRVYVVQFVLYRVLSIGFFGFLLFLYCFLLPKFWASSLCYKFIYSFFILYFIVEYLS